MSDTPQVWIGCLASYNAGRLIGQWVNATDVDEMNECQKQVAKEAWAAAIKCGDAPVYFGPPEEFFIADYDGFGSIASELGEYPSYELVARIGLLIEEHGVAFIGYAASRDDINDIDEDDFSNSYRGEFESEEAFALETVMEIGLPGVSLDPTFPKVDRYGLVVHGEYVNWIEEASSYIDWESVTRALFDHGNYSSIRTDTGSVHVYEGE